MKRKADDSTSGSKLFPKKKSKGASKSYIDRIIFAIRALKDHGGSSRQAVSKYLKSEFKADNKAALKKAFQSGVKSGLLIKNKQSFAVVGEAYAAAPGTTVTMEDLKLGNGAEAMHGSHVVVSYRGTLDDGSVFLIGPRRFLSS